MDAAILAITAKYIYMKGKEKRGQL